MDDTTGVSVAATDAAFCDQAATMRDLPEPDFENGDLAAKRPEFVTYFSTAVGLVTRLGELAPPEIAKQVGAVATMTSGVAELVKTAKDTNDLFDKMFTLMDNSEIETASMELDEYLQIHCGFSLSGNG
ncbi:MAG TPA: hypothetical protein PKV27_08765 [Ilumatobacteraceae bacterium]|nr:hypothetical protein [Ilumatobacteraceae bacterium]